MIQVYIGESFYRTSLDVYVVRKYDGHRRQILQLDNERFVQRWEELPEDGATTGDDKPTFSLPFDVGHAVLDALVRHYQGSEDTRALRRDYDAERKRVDHHVEVIADIARTLAIRAAH